MEKGKGATRKGLLNALRAIRQNNVADVYEDYLSNSTLHWPYIDQHKADPLIN